METQSNDKPEPTAGKSPLKRLVSRFPDYVPYRGFYDLRCFDMPFMVSKS